MIKFFSNIFGYILNYIYLIIGNYGIAIILFSIILKLLLLPLSIKQQKNIKKTEKIQKELAVIKEKNKNNPELLNQEMIKLYKRENMGPFSGCLSSIIQIILILSMFSLVRNPLTYMYKIPQEKINAVYDYIKEEESTQINTAYPQISILKYANNVEEEKEINYENEQIKLEEMKINMNFLGVDLSDVPQQNYENIRVFVIPILYVVSSIISIKIMAINKNKKENKEKEEGKEEDVDMMGQMSRSMNITMPILAVSVSLVAPLGLALYWLTNNILVIGERILINNIIKDKKEDNTNA